MHSLHPFVGIVGEIIAITVVLFFLAKAQKDGYGRGFKLAGYILLVVGFTVLAMTITHGIMRMGHHGWGEYENSCGPNGNCPMMGQGNCCDDDGKCDMKGEGKECCKEGTMKEGEECCKGGKMIGGKCVMDDSTKKAKPDSTKKK